MEGNLKNSESDGSGLILEMTNVLEKYNSLDVIFIWERGKEFN